MAATSDFVALPDDVLLKCSDCQEIFEFLSFQNHPCAMNNNDNRSTAYTREPIGPISELVPKRYHRYLNSKLLKSYLAANHLDADIFLKAADPADIPIITKAWSDTVYRHIKENLTDDGLEAVKDISPWIFNTLVDWSSDFEKLVCAHPLKEMNKSPTDPNNNIGKDNSEDAMSTITSSKPRESKTAEQPEELDKSQSGSSKIWRTSHVKRLIDLHIENEHKFNKKGSKKKVIWQEITDQINNMGNNFSYLQVEQKWKNLTQSFRATVDHNNKSGNDKKECPFFKELEEAYGYKANVKPIFTLGSITRDNNIGSDSESIAEGDSVGNSQDGDSPQTKRKADCSMSTSENTPEKQAKKKSSQVISLMETMRDEYKKEQEELLTELKKQHQDKMDKEDKKLELMSQMIAIMKK